MTSKAPFLSPIHGPDSMNIEKEQLFERSRGRAALLEKAIYEIFATWLISRLTESDIMLTCSSRRWRQVDSDVWKKSCKANELCFTSN
jgi:hypothetical protein